MNLVINNQITKKLEKIKNQNLSQKTILKLKEIEHSPDFQSLLNAQKIEKIKSKTVEYYIGRVTLDYRLLLTFENETSTWIAVDILNHDELSSKKI